MDGIRGSYYDGRSAVRREVLVSRQGEELRLTGANPDIRYPVAGIGLSPPLVGLGRTLRFPDGAVCEFPPGADPEAVLGLKERRLSRMLELWERSLPLVGAALLLTAFMVVGFVSWGIPFLARQVAYAVPPATEKALGRDTLEILDRMIFSPSSLPEPRRREIDTLFRGMVPDLPGTSSYRLEFRSGARVGANAFALPSGIIIVTDSLVKLARNNDELMGVLAHETAHVRKRHALRHVFQDSASSLVIVLLTGDVLSLSSLSATLPTVLIDASYSRDFEREADDETLAFLDKRGISRKSYADMLARLQADHDREAGFRGEKRSATSAGWFSTHPVTEERIRRIMN